MQDIYRLCHFQLQCIPRPFRRGNPAESHLSISSRQGFWRRNLVHCALATAGGATDHKFNKYGGMEAVVFFTLLSPVLFLGLSPESVINLCSFSLSSTQPNWHWRQILLCPHPWRKYPAERKKWNGLCNFTCLVAFFMAFGCYFPHFAKTKVMFAEIFNRYLLLEKSSSLVFPSFSLACSDS